MVNKYNDIMTALRAGTYAPIYILCGEEPYYIDQVYSFIADHALDEMAREFDQQVLYGRDLQGADIAPVIGAARGFAMMGGRKVIIVREAQAVKKWDALAAYLDNLMPQTVLVLCYNGKPAANLTNVRAFGRKRRTIRRSCGCSPTNCGTTRSSDG